MKKEYPVLFWLKLELRKREFWSTKLLVADKVTVGNGRRKKYKGKIC